MGLETIMETVNSELFGVWFLIGAVLVFFMQCGFAMVETGFTRAKNAGNIIMKNLMDFCIGTVMFILLGYGLCASLPPIPGFLYFSASFLAPSFDSADSHALNASMKSNLLISSGDL